jgi:hypothetical protein
VRKLPFSLPTCEDEDGGGGMGGASKVKFSKKTSTLTLVFDGTFDLEPTAAAAAEQQTPARTSAAGRVGTFRVILQSRHQLMTAGTVHVTSV